MLSISRFFFVSGRTPLRLVLSCLGARQRRTCSFFDWLGGWNDGRGRNVSAIGSLEAMAGEVGLRLRSLAEPRDDRLKAQGSRATPIPFLRPFESLPPRRTYGMASGMPRPRFLVGAGMVGKGGMSPPPAACK